MTVGNVVPVDVADAVFLHPNDDELEPSVADFGFKAELAVVGDGLLDIQAAERGKNADEGRPLHGLRADDLGGGGIDREDGAVRVEPQNGRRIEVREGRRFRHVFARSAGGSIAAQVGNIGSKLLAAHLAVHDYSSLPAGSVSSMERL